MQTPNAGRGTTRAAEKVPSGGSEWGALSKPWQGGDGPTAPLLKREGSVPVASGSASGGGQLPLCGPGQVDSGGSPVSACCGGFCFTVTFLGCPAPGVGSPGWLSEPFERQPTGGRCGAHWANVCPIGCSPVFRADSLPASARLAPSPVPSEFLSFRLIAFVSQSRVRATENQVRTWPLRVLSQQPVIGLLPSVARLSPGSPNRHTVVN